MKSLTTPDFCYAALPQDPISWMRLPDSQMSEKDLSMRLPDSQMSEKDSSMRLPDSQMSEKDSLPRI